MTKTMKRTFTLLIALLLAPLAAHAQQLTLTLHIALWVGRKISGRKWGTCNSVFCRPSFCRFLLSVLLLATCTRLPAAEFFVSRSGNDSNPGTEAKPLATLERARDAARQQGAAGRVVVRRGVYYLKQTLTLEPQDSGLTIEAAKGEEVVISGGRVVNEWQPWRGEVLQSDLGKLDLPDCKFQQLYFEGRRQPLARVPNFDPEHPRIGGVLFNERLVEAGTKTKFGYRAGELDPAKWTHPERATLVFHDSLNYEQTWAPLKSVDAANRVLEAARGVYVLAPGCPYYVCGLLMWTRTAKRSITGRRRACQSAISSSCRRSTRSSSCRATPRPARSSRTSASRASRSAIAAAGRLT